MIRQIFIFIVDLLCCIVWLRGPVSTSEQGLRRRTTTDVSIECIATSSCGARAGGPIGYGLALNAQPP